MHKACLPCDEAEGARGLRGPAPGSRRSEPAARRSCPRSAGLPRDDPALVTTCTWPWETPKKSLSRRQWWPLQIADQQQDIKVIDPKPGPRTPLCAGLSLSSMQPTARGSLGPDLEDTLLGTALPQDGQSRGRRGRRQNALPACPFPTEPEGGVARAPPPVASVLAEPRGGSWASSILGQKLQSHGESVSASRGQQGWSPAGRREPHYPARFPLQLGTEPQGL